MGCKALVVPNIVDRRRVLLVFFPCRETVCKVKIENGPEFGRVFDHVCSSCRAETVSHNKVFGIRAVRAQEEYGLSLILTARVLGSEVSCDLYDPKADLLY